MAIWIRNNAPAGTKGIRLHLSAVDGAQAPEDDRAVSVLAEKDSHGGLVILGHACEPIRLVLPRSITCDDCEPEVKRKVVSFPPGTVRAAATSETTPCCEE